MLFGIVFLWQLPHFLAIAWMYRDDYARAGLPMLPVIEPDGRSTGRQAVLYAAALLPVSLAPTLVGMTGAAYFVGRAGADAAVPGLALRFAMTRAVRDARRLFFGSIIYLPLLWVLMIADRTVEPAAAVLARIFSCGERAAAAAKSPPHRRSRHSNGFLRIKSASRQRHAQCHRDYSARQRLRADPPRPDPAAPRADARRVRHFGAVPDLATSSTTHVGSRPFPGRGAIRTIYFTILITHIVLAAAILPLALSRSRGPSKPLRRHIRIARWTLPLWLYVSVTGVVVYVMLYQM